MLHHVGHAGRVLARRYASRTSSEPILKVSLSASNPSNWLPSRVEIGPGIEQRAEDLLHRGDMRADCHVAAQIFLQVGGRREVVGMNVCFENPLQCCVRFWQTRAISRSAEAVPVRPDFGS